MSRQSERVAGRAGERDYIEMQSPMLPQDRPEDFVIVAGAQYSVRQFIHFAAQALRITIAPGGNGGYESGTTVKAEERLRWTPKTGLRALVKEIVETDCTAARKNSLVTLAGFRSFDHRKLSFA